MYLPLDQLEPCANTSPRCLACGLHSKACCCALIAQHQVASSLPFDTYCVVHPNELKRLTNTGHLIPRCLYSQALTDQAPQGDSQDHSQGHSQESWPFIVWQRKEGEGWLQQQISKRCVYLVYPPDDKRQNVKPDETKAHDVKPHDVKACSDSASHATDEAQISPLSVLKRVAQDGAPTTKPLLVFLDGTWQESAKMLRHWPWLAELPRISLALSQSRYHFRRNQKGVCTFEAAIGCVAQVDKTLAQSLADFFEQYLQHLQASQSGHGVKTGQSS